MLEPKLDILKANNDSPKIYDLLLLLGSFAAATGYSILAGGCLLQQQDKNQVWAYTYPYINISIVLRQHADCVSSCVWRPQYLITSFTFDNICCFFFEVIRFL